MPHRDIKLGHQLEHIRCQTMVKSVNEYPYGNPLLRVKRNITIENRRTSLVLEQQVWNILDELSREEGLTIDEICSQIQRAHQGKESISSVLRVVAMLACQQNVDEFPRDSNELHVSRTAFPSRLHQALMQITR